MFEQYFDGFVKNTLDALESAVNKSKVLIARKNFVENVMTPLKKSRIKLSVVSKKKKEHLETTEINRKLSKSEINNY